MYGKRGKIGLLVPAVNSTMEAEFHRLVPDGVSVHTNRMPLLRSVSSVETIEAMVEAFETVAMRVRELAEAGVGVVMFGCTSGSFAKGPAGDRRLQEAMARDTGLALFTTTTASVEAARALGLRRLAVVTPYPAEVNARLRAYFEACEIDVVNLATFDEPDMAAHAAHEPEEVAALVRHADRPEADGLFVACTQVRAIDAADRLERELGKPVITANQASLWVCLRALKVPDPIRGFGRLLELPR
jgi:maleate cis-trans isomerase